MRIRAKVSQQKFSAGVFGGDCFIAQFPELFKSGIDVELYDEFYYVIVNGRKVGHTHFFSQEEVDKYFEVVDDSLPSIEDWKEIKKVLKWVNDNPGCHPENIRKELEKLYQKHIGV